jgi:hypothetical protein
MTSVADELLAFMAAHHARMKNISDEEFIEFLAQNYYSCIRKLEDGTWVALGPQTYRACAIFIGIDPFGYVRRYDYNDSALAKTEILKLEHGAQVPTGWIERTPK